MGVWRARICAILGGDPAAWFSGPVLQPPCMSCGPPFPFCFVGKVARKVPVTGGGRVPVSVPVRGLQFDLGSSFPVRVLAATYLYSRNAPIMAAARSDVNHLLRGGEEPAACIAKPSDKTWGELCSMYPDLITLKRKEQANSTPRAKSLLLPPNKPAAKEGRRKAPSVPSREGGGKSNRAPGRNPCYFRPACFWRPGRGAAVILAWVPPGGSCKHFRAGSWIFPPISFAPFARVLCRGPLG